MLQKTNKSWRSPTLKTYFQETVMHEYREDILRFCVSKSGRFIVTRSDNVLYSGTDIDKAIDYYGQNGVVFN